MPHDPRSTWLLNAPTSTVGELQRRWSSDDARHAAGRDGHALGVICLFRSEVKPFSAQQVSLLQTFADQAVIAIENVRLFTELGERNRDLTEALEQQTATSEVLRVISRSQTDAQPVFDTIAAAALRLCRASVANVVRLDGETIRIVALANVSAEGAETLHTLFPGCSAWIRGGTGDFTCSVAAIPDVLIEPGYRIGQTAPVTGFRSVVVGALARGGMRSAINVDAFGPFLEKQIALLQTFADQAVIAIENARLIRELEARTHDLTQSVNELKALGEVGQAVSSTLDLGTVLSTIVSRATELAGLDGGAIYEYDEARGVPPACDPSAAIPARGDARAQPSARATAACWARWRSRASPPRCATSPTSGSTRAACASC
jgi:GAF domain-containing protein